ncbi:hypothetical protein AJ80_07707 [Polytolypa hystricis UAMH7299]|uniref:Uncharacterized protein n=1 Tax=Polytolypa hystricis (strain UAMH7299) TaxID=1447883 RepID=A0A2B7XJZ1_POLH7|nr:hypothetical protein AJ80_07707 [Polytolypa hystricis UAMH7299]
MPNSFFHKLKDREALDTFSIRQLEKCLNSHPCIGCRKPYGGYLSVLSGKRYCHECVFREPNYAGLAQDNAEVVIAAQAACLCFRISLHYFRPHIRTVRWKEAPDEETIHLVSGTLAREFAIRSFGSEGAMEEFTQMIYDITVHVHDACRAAWPDRADKELYLMWPMASTEAMHLHALLCETSYFQEIVNERAYVPLPEAPMLRN